MKLIVGLGNPGKEYEKTRHNVGFMSVDKILNKYGINSMKTKYGGLFSEQIIGDEKVIILKPQKYINLSGEVISEFVNYYKINVNDILIIHDDLDLPVGKYRLRSSGSSGGHNGLKNIELCLATDKYKRLKIGISNNKTIDTKDYVLGKLNDEDFKIIDKITDISIDIVSDFIKLSFDELMNKYNSN